MIIDVIDNFDICFILNDLLYKYEVFWIYGLCVGSYGVIYIVILNVIFCLYCILKKVFVGGVICEIVGIISFVV